MMYLYKFQCGHQEWPLVITVQSAPLCCWLLSAASTNVE